ncbi:MAG: nucleotide pyrophosphohydrolase [Magnetococcales bacterium]|nr:nucleotide pyrophosphohydrolase [Magnetococcales bacterium]
MSELRAALKKFSQERDWEQFHTSKNLAMALSVEVAEIVEMFQWLTSDESETLNPEQSLHLAEEVGDVMIYLTMLAAKYNLDPIECARSKMVKNSRKYPAKPK